MSSAASGPGTLVFFALAALVIACAALVAFSRDMLHAALALLGTLAGVAGLYLHLGADFLGISQLLIYVGGVLVLVLFAVLLTTRIGDVKASNTSLGRALALPVAAAAAVGLVSLVTWVRWPETEAVAAPTTSRLGEAFLREYLLPFELISIVLLAALVGAMVLARRAVNPPPAPPPA
jgi:NAD(P)H-quinone oxidoreductase subunit 6